MRSAKPFAAKSIISLLSKCLVARTISFVIAFAPGAQFITPLIISDSIFFKSLASFAIKSANPISNASLPVKRAAVSMMRLALAKPILCATKGAI